MGEDNRDMNRWDESGVERVLLVAAHPDDAEYGTSAAVAEWTSRGIGVGYLLLTAGEAGMQRPPKEARTIRAAEQQQAGELVGIERLTILDFPDGTLEYGLPLRRAIAREIRTYQPHAVITGSGELFVPWGIDHPDHRAAGVAAIDAVRDADNPWVFQELHAEEGLEPWSTSWLMLTDREADVFVPVTQAAEAKAVASLEAHDEYLADLSDHPAPADFIPEMLQEMGSTAGIPRAVTFQAHRL